MLLPIDRAREFFAHLTLPAPLDEATDLLLGEIRARLRFLADVGLGYLTLDRQSRTLSGGEVQRINLTTALGTSLVNTLFVLDEPSIGLHPRDMGRVIGVMQRLRDAGNSLVVVEHDPQVMLAADRVLDIGPGPGERGGEIVFFGTPRRAARRTPRSLTGRLPRRAASAPARAAHGGARRDGARIEILGAAEHNLQGHRRRDSAPPHSSASPASPARASRRSCRTCCTRRCCAPRASRPRRPARIARIAGAELIDDVVLVDQTPIGRTTRSNPASYVGAFDAIRKLFAAAPLAREREYTPGTFSFNAGNGRCPTCAGNGFEHVEMQFLSDVYLRCPDCDGRRYRAEVLEVDARRPLDRRRARHDGRARRARSSPAIADIEAALAPLVDVGLDYLRLGQPVPTLSGGEAQRLKLAGFLRPACTARGEARRTGTLFLFDEPTTGLHFDDVARLLDAFRQLIAAGHSLVVIEHNLDVIRAADWIIDLGPEGGDAGGRVVVAGTRRRRDRVRRFAHGRRARRRTKRRSARRRRAPRRQSLREPARTSAPTRSDPHPQRARAQPQEHRRRDSARPLHRRDRRVGQRQEHARLRHPVRRRPAPLPRIAQRVRAAVRAARVAPRRRRDLRHSADGRDRAAHEPRRPQEHGRDADRDLPLPAPALRQARHAALPGRRHADRAAERGGHRAQRPARLPRAAHRAARAAGRRAQGLLHRSRQVGGAQGLRRAARRRRAAADAIAGRGSIASRSTRSSCRSPSSSSTRATSRACAKALARALELGKGVGARHALGREGGTGAKRGAMASRGVLDQARVPDVQPQLPRARSAAVLVQFEARLVPDLLRHRREARGLRRRADRRGSWWNEWCETTSRRVRGLSRRAPQARGARGALPRAIDRGADATLRRRRRALSSRSSISKGARPRSRATSWPSSRRGSPFSTTSASAISRSIARRRRSRAARRSASGSPHSSARTCAACATSSTSRRSACIRATTACCSTRSRKLAGQGQHARRRRARRGHDPPRRPRDRSRAGRGQPRRQGRRRRARRPS